MPLKRASCGYMVPLIIKFAKYSELHPAKTTIQITQALYLLKFRVLRPTVPKLYKVVATHNGTEGDKLA